jgi:hypothetical protein
VSIPPEVFEGSTGGALMLAALLAGRRWPTGRIRIDATAVSAQTEAANKQTRAIERQTEAAVKVAERLGHVDQRLDDLVTEVRGLREDLHGIDRRVIRLETAQERNGNGTPRRR